MALDTEKMLRKADEILSNITPDEIDKYFPPNNLPKGWVNIEDHLPMMFAIDIMEGYSVYKVKDKSGNEFESAVSDHTMWYYMAKDAGITHWWNANE